MSVPILQFIHSQPQPQNGQNQFGETPLPYAPRVQMSNGECAVPQQFLDVERNLTNLSNVLACVTVPQDYQLFAGTQGSCLFLIVGLIGKENYPDSPEVAAQKKIVYGRRWLIEETTPTSEIVQTAMLAVKKAREHEVRELLSLRVNNDENVTTPFNCHLDLPLMAGNRSDLAGRTCGTIIDLIARIRVAGRSLELLQSAQFAGKSLFEIKLRDDAGQSHFPELDNQPLTIICKQDDSSDFLHQLISELIHRSDRYVEELVEFDGFKRFSRDLCPVKLAEFSYQTRNVAATDARFDAGFKDMSYRVDASKAPVFNVGKLGRQQRALLEKHPNLMGYLPKDN